jgi:type II secretory pathway pseudopilin PulG
MFNKKNVKAFTIVELLMVIALITVMMAVMIPISTDYQQRNDLDVAQTTFSQGVRRAQQLAMASDTDSQWGINAVSGNIVIFKGASYAARDTSVDESFDTSTAITITGQTEYVFAKLSGTPSQTGTITFTNGNYQKTVGVNGKGIVSY